MFFQSGFRREDFWLRKMMSGSLCLFWTHLWLCRLFGLRSVMEFAVVCCERFMEVYGVVKVEFRLMIVIWKFNSASSSVLSVSPYEGRFLSAEKWWAAVCICFGRICDCVDYLVCIQWRLWWSAALVSRLSVKEFRILGGFWLVKAGVRLT
jgi:hypothetical protein